MKSLRTSFAILFCSILIIIIFLVVVSDTLSARMRCYTYVSCVHTRTLSGGALGLIYSPIVDNNKSMFLIQPSLIIWRIS